MTGNPAILKSIKEADLQWSYHGRSTPVDSFCGTGMSRVIVIVILGNLLSEFIPVDLILLASI